MKYRMSIVALLAIFMLSDVYADTAQTTSNSLALAHKFSPILILTEATSREFGNLRVTKPEPVEIMGAESASNLWFYLYPLDLLESYSHHSPLNGDWNPNIEEIIERVYPKINFAQNKFAFLNLDLRYKGTPPGGIDSDYRIRFSYFDYPGTAPALWDSTYFGEGHYAGTDNKHKGSDFANTAYVHIYDRTHDVYDETLTVIQYFYFYPYNHWWNRHEGDWQKINVVVSSRDPSRAAIIGVEYFFHGAHLSYYKNYFHNIYHGTELEATVEMPGLASSFVFNPRDSLKVSQGTHPIVYVGAGSHAAYPTGGSWHIFRYTDPVEDKWENMTHTGLVLRTQIDDSNRSLQENYDLVLLPEPNPSQANMGLSGTMSWLGANVRWGTPRVKSPGLPFLGNALSPCPNNRSPEGPFHKGWEDLKFFTSSHTGGCGGIAEYGITHSVIPAEFTTGYHHWAVIGADTLRGHVSLNGDVVVFPGATLTIQAGTTVTFPSQSDRHQFKEGNNSLSELFVYGTLKSDGTSSPVVFRGPNLSDRAQHWGGIRMMAGSSEEVRATQIHNAPPPTIRPTKLTTTVGDGAVTLRWEEPSPSDPSITGWEYHTKLEGAEEWGPWTAVSGRATRQVKVSPLEYGVRHQFEVRAVNANTIGGGPASETVSASLLEVAFSAANYTLIESGNPVGLQDVIAQAEDPTQAAKKVQVVVQLTPATDRRVTIPLTVAAGSAEATDYNVRGLPASGEVSFTAGGLEKKFTILANADADFDDETIYVGFGAALPVGVRVGSPATATVTLYDTPSAPTGLVAEGGNKQVTLRWDDPGNRGITGWQYQQRRTGDGSLWSGWINMSLSDVRTTEDRVYGAGLGRLGDWLT